MRIVVIGSTGGTGLQLLRQGIDRGHEIVAIARRPDAITTKDERLQVVAGDVGNRAGLTDAMIGADVVVSSLGIGGLMASRKAGTLLSDGTRNILAAMQDAGVARTIIVSSVGVVEDPTEGIVYRAILKPIFLRNLYIDMAKMEEMVGASDRDWTLVRPPLLLDKPARGAFKIEIGGNVPGGRVLTRADLAAFILDTAESKKHVRQIVGLSH